MRSPVLVACLLFACSASKDPDPARNDRPDTGFAIDAADEGGITFDAGDGGDPPKAKSCSADLRTVTDAMGNVQKVCAPDQGCFEGECIPVCDAAAKSKGSVGCKFLVATPSFQPVIAPPCFAVFLANNGAKDVKITVARDGATFDVTTFARTPTGSADATAWPAVPASGLPSGKVGVLFLSNDPTSANGTIPMTCPVPPAIGAGTALRDTGKGAAFAIETDAPVSAYDILPYGGANSFLPSAELLLPTTAWGTNYVAVVPPRHGSKAGPQWGQIVAAEDGTEVTIKPTTALTGAAGAPTAPAGVATKFSLNRGEYVQWQDSGDMTGSVVASTKPVAFVGGNGYLCLTSKTSVGGGCDSGHQMVPPVSALGSEYVGAPYVTRRADLKPESVLYRVVGTVDGTTLTYDPPVAAPTALSRGQSFEFETTTAFTVKSQDADHPFYLAQMMSGADVTSGSRPGSSTGASLGDEEFVNVLPPAQFLSKYVFFTDPTYATTNLVVTRKKTATGFKDVKLACAGVISGFQPVGTSGLYEVATLDLVRANVGVGACTNGPQTAESEGPFGIMVWGTDAVSSYAYPAGGNVGTINPVVVEPVPK